jgi:hypothetical protein
LRGKKYNPDNQGPCRRKVRKSRGYELRKPADLPHRGLDDLEPLAPASMTARQPIDSVNISAVCPKYMSAMTRKSYRWVRSRMHRLDLKKI